MATALDALADALCQDMSDENEAKWVRDVMSDLIAAGWAVVPREPKSGDLVARLREKIVADAFEDGRITSGALAHRLLHERLDAADEIERQQAMLRAAAG